MHSTLLPSSIGLYLWVTFLFHVILLFPILRTSTKDRFMFLCFTPVYYSMYDGNAILNWNYFCYFRWILYISVQERAPFIMYITYNTTQHKVIFLSRMLCSCVCIYVCEGIALSPNSTLPFHSYFVLCYVNFTFTVLWYKAYEAITTQLNSLSDSHFICAWSSPFIP